MTLTASCNAGPDIDVVAETSKDNSSIHLALTSAGPITTYSANNAFDTGATFNVLPVDDAVQGTLTLVTPFVSFLSLGSVTTVTFMAEEVQGLGGTRACVFAGTGMTSNPSIVFSLP